MQDSSGLDSFSQYDVWAECSQHQQLFVLESEGVRTVFDHFKPYKSLVLGSDVPVVASQNPFVIRLSHNARRGLPANVEANYGYLPFGDDTFDLIVCPHIHEMVACEDRFFSELSRVVMPEGLVVFYGFNPAGLLQCYNWGGLGHSYPWLSRVFYRRALIERLAYYDFEYVYHGYGVHRPALSFAEEIPFLSRWLPSCGGVYKLVLRRRQLQPVACSSGGFLSHGY